jgi:hypothetical protein
MGTLAGLIVLFFGGGYLIRSVSSVRNSAWAGPRTAGMRRRAGVTRGGGVSGPRPVRHEARLRRLDAELKDWLAGRDHARKNGSGTAPAATARPPAAPGRARAAATAAGSRLRDRFSRAGILVTAEDGGHGAPHWPGQDEEPPPGGRDRKPYSWERPRQPGRAPEPAPSSNGGTPVAAGTGGTEQLVEGINQVHAAAVSGGIHAKQHGVKASTEGSIRFSQMASMLSRTMSEPGSNYGPEITEPLGKASQHLQAAAMAFGEADAALTTLMSMSVGELAASSRQAPHHGELSENGSK